jgi:hypothetical protein
MFRRNTKYPATNCKCPHKNLATAVGDSRSEGLHRRIVVRPFCSEQLFDVDAGAAERNELKPTTTNACKPNKRRNQKYPNLSNFAVGSAILKNAHINSKNEQTGSMLLPAIQNVHTDDVYLGAPHTERCERHML